MVGTPPVIATFSRSMISIACTGSHLRMKIVVLPPAIVPISPAEQAVTWNMGMTVRLVRGRGSGTGSTRRRQLRAAANAPDHMVVAGVRGVQIGRGWGGARVGTNGVNRGGAIDI